MRHHVFSKPVSIVVGLNFPTRIESVASAYAVLCDWSQEKRDDTHRRAINACKAAFGGEIEADTVRAPFIAFARKHGILMPENEPVIAAQHGRTVSQPMIA